MVCSTFRMDGIVIPRYASVGLHLTTSLPIFDLTCISVSSTNVNSRFEKSQCTEPFASDRLALTTEGVKVIVRKALPNRSVFRKWTEVVSRLLRATDSSSLLNRKEGNHF